MKTKKNLILAAATLVVWLVTGTIAGATEPIFMRIQGIDGEVTLKGREGQIEVFAFNHEVAAPFDATSGQASGKRSHSPVKVVTRISKATPLIAQALGNNQVIPKIEIFFWNTSPNGIEQNYFKITIENCRVASRRLWSPNKLDPSTATYIPLEELAFVYQKITWTYVSGGVEYQDTWGLATP